MPSWKKVIVSGSDAAVPSVSTAGDFTIDAGGDIILDADGTDAFLKIINSMDVNTNVFVISHKGEILYDKFLNTIKFVKEKNFSKIETV